MARVVLKYDKLQERENKTCCNIRCCQVAATTAGVILLYCSLSIGLTFYQRWLLQWLHFPLFITTGHLVIKFVLATIVRSIMECYYQRPRVVLDWYNYVTRLAPVGLASGFDVAFSNWGLELITVSLYVMTKSTAIIFILIFALMFKLEKKSWRLVVIVLMISGGLTMFTYKSTQFNLLGFILALLATLSSGLRWTLTQLLMQKSKLGLSNPVDFLYHAQPWMIVMVLPFAVSFEGLAVASSCRFFNFTYWDTVLHNTCVVLIGALIAFCMECAENLVVTCTSSLTLSVAGIFKEVCTVIIAVQWNGDQISGINAIGLLLCLLGISIHVILKAIAVSDSMPDVNSENQGEMCLRNIDSTELRVPLLSDDTSFSNQILLDDSDSDDNSNVLFNVLQRRDNTSYDVDDR